MCLLHPPTARGADLKNHGCSGGDTDAKLTLPHVPFFPGGGLGAQGGHLVACAVLGDSPPETWPLVAGNSGQLAAVLRWVPAVSPFRFVFRARGALGWDFLHAPRVCVRTARFCAQGALWDPRLTASPRARAQSSLDCDGDQVCLRSVFHG